MAKLSEFMEKLLEKPDITSEEEQWRIRAKMDNNVDYRCGYRDCLKVMMNNIIKMEDELRDLADSSIKKFENGSGAYYDGVYNTCWTAVGKLQELVDEVKKHDSI